MRECPQCGLFQHLPSMRPGFTASCSRCGALLRRRRRNSFHVVSALVITGFALFNIILFQPLLGFRLYGRVQDTTLPAMPFAFEQFGMWQLTLVVLGVTVLAPMLKLLLTAGVLLGLQFRIHASALAAMARVRSWLGPWAMIEVFLLGVFVAYTRLTSYATVQIGAALYALGALMFVTVCAEAWLDEHAMWDAIARLRPRHDRPGVLLGCDTCGHVMCGQPGELCCVCDSRLRLRKPDPLTRSWALVLSAIAMYIPANILPTLTIVQLGRTTSSTIIGGVQELIAYRMWPLALIVFTASIAVPMVKLLMLIWMLVSTQRHSAAGLRRRTKMYRFIDVIGRWSMIDVFVIALLTALIQMGFFASVIPEPGAICFCGVVILTMLAVASFDPRTMWDAAGERQDPNQLVETT